MRFKYPFVNTLAILVVLAASASSVAEDSVVTTITVPDMHCTGCAKKMAAKLVKVPGVEKVGINVPATQLTVTPKPSQAISPKGMWEAIVKAGYKPAKLEGPDGSFTKKPKF